MTPSRNNPRSPRLKYCLQQWAVVRRSHLCVRYTMYSFCIKRTLFGTLWDLCWTTDFTLLLFNELWISGRDWSAEHPLLIPKVPLHGVKFGVWCAISATRIVVPVSDTHTHTQTHTRANVSCPQTTVGDLKIYYLTIKPDRNMQSFANLSLI
jgi:hypothetical protein